jgi:hypothetical protein
MGCSKEKGGERGVGWGVGGAEGKEVVCTV